MFKNHWSLELSRDERIQSFILYVKKDIQDVWKLSKLYAPIDKITALDFLLGKVYSLPKEWMKDIPGVWNGKQQERDDSDRRKELLSKLKTMEVSPSEFCKTKEYQELAELDDIRFYQFTLEVRAPRSAISRKVKSMAKIAFFAGSIGLAVKSVAIPAYAIAVVTLNFLSPFINQAPHVLRYLGAGIAII